MSLLRVHPVSIRPAHHRPYPDRRHSGLLVIDAHAVAAGKHTSVAQTPFLCESTVPGTLCLPKNALFSVEYHRRREMERALDISSDLKVWLTRAAVGRSATRLAQCFEDATQRTTRGLHFTSYCSYLLGLAVVLRARWVSKNNCRRERGPS